MTHIPLDCVAECNGACCKFIRIPLQGATPDDKRFFNMHENLWVYDNYLEIKSRCSHLNEKGLCDIYEHRPKACRLFLRGCELCLEARKREGFE